MARRITADRLKKYAIATGIIGVPLGIVLIIFLLNLGVIDVISYSGDMYCNDTCFINVTFEAKEDLFIYPFDASWLVVDNKEAIHLIKTYRTWGNRLQRLKFNETCNGAWCGCGWCDSSHKAKFSYVFRKGRTYTLVYEIQKDPRADVKWSWFNDTVDPLLIGDKTIDDVFKELKTNDGVKKVSTFSMYAPSTLSRDKMNITFNEVCGKVIDYKIFIKDTCQTSTVVNEIPIYSEREVCSDVFDEVDNLVVISQECINESYISSYDIEEEIINTSCYKEIDEIPYGENDYKIEGNIDMGRCKDKWGYKIDWIPHLETINNTFTQKKWAWWNVSYDYRRNITKEPISNLGFTMNQTGEWCEKNIEINPTYSYNSFDSNLKIDLASYYTFDGDARDYSGSNDGTVLNGTEHIDSGKISGAYGFDGIDDFIDLGDVTFLDGATSASWSFWINLDILTFDASIIRKWYAGGQTFGIRVNTILDNTANLTLLLNTDAGQSVINTDTTVLNTTVGWQHIVFSWNGGNDTKLYVDNVEKSLSVAGVTPTALVNSAEHLSLMARYNNGVPDKFVNGSLDEVGIWNRSLTATEIGKLYNTTKDLYLYYNNCSSYTIFDESHNEIPAYEVHELGTGNNPTDVPSPDTVASYHFGWDDDNETNDSTSNDNLGSLHTGEPTLYSDNLVGFWKLNDDALDETGVNNGTATDVTYAVSPRVKSGEFNGVTSKIQVADDSSLEGMDTLTIAAWIKFKGAGITTAIVYKNGPYLFRFYANNRTSVGIYNGTWTYATSEIIVDGSSWHFVIANYNGSEIQAWVDGVKSGSSVEKTGPLLTSGANLFIGSAPSSNFWNGSIDTVMIWNRSLTDSEVENVYNQTRLKYTDDGKYGGAFEFDGVDDYIESPDSDELDIDYLTITAWIYTKSYTPQAIVTKWSDTEVPADNRSFRWIFHETSPNLCMSFRSDGTSGVEGVTCSTTNLSIDTWYFITVLYNGSETRTYINGVLENTTTYSAGIYKGEFPLRIGLRSSTANQNFNGTIDEVEIFNRALSAIEIQEKYNNSISDRNMVLEEQEALDTCENCDGLENCYMDCSDNCEITSNIDNGGFNIIINQSLTGQGNLTLSANITNYGTILPSGFNSTDRCIIKCNNGGCFI